MANRGGRREGSRADLEPLCGLSVWLWGIRQEPYYAIKCNTDPQVLRTLLPLCGGFDCASMGEITTMLDLGVSPDKVRRGGPLAGP